MKPLLLTLLLLLPIGLFAQDSISQQEAHLNKVLYKIEKQFGLSDRFIILHVKRDGTTKAKGVWGDSWQDEDGGHIEILALEDYPPAMPAREARRFQEKVLQHEVMHFELTHLGVPGDFQDGLIEGLQGALRRP
jgi:hypothetical protein